MVTCLTYRTREGSKDSISNFQEPLKFETWDNIYTHDDINIIFNSILNTLLFFNLVFPFTIPLGLRSDHRCAWWLDR